MLSFSVVNRKMNVGACKCNYSAISSFFRPHPPLRGTLPIREGLGSLPLTRMRPERTHITAPSLLERGQPAKRAGVRRGRG